MDSMDRHHRDTLRHINAVQVAVYSVISRLEARAITHDQSKLVAPEAEKFAEVNAGGGLSEVEYDSEEYHEKRAELGEALEHHYAENDHHPEHFENGIGGMDLMQLTEMLCDWKAASGRHEGEGHTIFDSIEKNAERFEIPAAVVGILWRTAASLWPEDLEEYEAAR